MLLTSIALSQFRNFTTAHHVIGPHLTIIVGNNAQGKTSLLEGIYVAVYGTGFRESKELELICFPSTESMIESYFSHDGMKEIFQVAITRASESTVTKTYYVGKAKKTSRFYRDHQTHAVLFAPEQIQIITGSPGRRRRYLDTVISASDPEYKRSLRMYETALRSRNKLLEAFEDERTLDEQIGYWDMQVVAHSAVITAGRTRFVQYLNNHQEKATKPFSISYHSDPCTRDRLREVSALERRFRRTVIGPQKDDFQIFLHESSKGRKKEVHLYGSRSEQRMAIFWLKLNELSYLEELSGIRPILLLDDIFSELDDTNRHLVTNVIKEYQTIATTTEEEIQEIAATSVEMIRL